MKGHRNLFSRYHLILHCQQHGAWSQVIKGFETHTMFLRQMSMSCYSRRTTVAHSRCRCCVSQANRASPPASPSLGVTKTPTFVLAVGPPSLVLRFFFLVRKGASPLSMGSLCGVGDLVLTCTGSLSRNWTVGNRMAKGEARYVKTQRQNLWPNASFAISLSPATHPYKSSYGNWIHIYEYPQPSSWMRRRWRLSCFPLFFFFFFNFSNFWTGTSAILAYSLQFLINKQFFRFQSSRRNISAEKTLWGKTKQKMRLSMYGQIPFVYGPLHAQKDSTARVGFPSILRFYATATCPMSFAPRTWGT